jgi:glucuronokinase
MIELAALAGAPAKFSGSGGAVVGISTGDEQTAQLEALFTEQGFGFVRITPHEPVEP